MNHKQGGQTQPCAPGTSARSVFDSEYPDAREAKISYLLIHDDCPARHSHGQALPDSYRGGLLPAEKILERVSRRYRPAA